ncbi:ABC transporter substrate-binding protein [Leucobacter aridicollis]|uniref:ABC transporter substrate-binding protein n=1 Tax=Leucobacter aridicollis TaxID=283878 RepID=UPI0021685B79|nr:ABC transporter substrate-binding protein [Leucobacter aridicollis]MCS3428638.1 peptide/nickel transport system substrate-binding protein [Leucobacter aridicollis]
MTPTSRRAVVALALAATLGLAGCAPATQGDGAEPNPTAGGTLTYGRLASANDLDLHTQITANNAFAIDKIFESLVSFDEHGKIVDWLAKSHEISADGLTYTFTLRDGLKYSDGTDVNATDVKFSLERNLAKEGPLMLTAPISEIAADDEAGTVVITLSEAYTPFLSELTSFSAGVVPKDFGGKTEDDFFTAPIGTGPFAIGEWDPAGDLNLVKNEHYWQDGKPLLDGLDYVFVADDNQLLQRLNAGQIDAIEQVPAANAESVEKGDTTKLLKSDSWAIEQIFFNTQKPEFADVHVRRAIAQALDLPGITQATTFGTARAASSLIPPAIEYSAADAFDAEPVLAHDVDAAKQELAKSAFTDGFEVTMLIPSGNSARAQIAQVVQESLAPLGIDVQIEAIDLASFRERFKAFDYDFMISSGQSDAPDPNGLVTFQADPEGFSNSFWTHYTNPEVTKLMHEGRTTADGPEREQIYTDIQRILASDVPYIPVYYSPNLHGTTAKVYGLESLPNGSVRFQDAWVEAK